jgi:hypothetical protein
MSELGFVYFFGRTDARKAVMVYFISLVFSQKMATSYIQSMAIRRSSSGLYASHRSRE